LADTRTADALVLLLGITSPDEYDPKHSVWFVQICT